jgi:phosphoglycolate phosphatase
MPPTLVFDLDGTLVDTAPDLVAALNVVLADIGSKPLAADEARTMIGHGARAMIGYGLMRRGIAAAAVDMERLLARFLAHYEAHIADASRPLEGLTEALDALDARGHRFAVLTNKVERLARKLLEELRIAPRFAAVVGGDSFPFAKPDPRVFAATLARAGLADRAAMMIGDSRTDVDTGRAAGAPVVLVDFGYADTLARELGADRVISSWSELPAAVEALAAAGARLRRGERHDMA